MSETTTYTLLEPDDPPPVEEVNPDSEADVLLVCEHAGRGLPARLGDLGLPPEELERHIAWDIGALAVAKLMAARLDAPLVAQHYSRLVIDCNRPPEVATSVPKVSDETIVPANQAVSPAERQARIEEIFRPFERAIAHQLDRAPRRLLADIHSFTPVMQQHHRPWEIGLLFNRDDRAARLLMGLLVAKRPDIVAAFNKPYSVSDQTDFTIPTHGEKRGLPHVLIEIRNDLIREEAGQAYWADLLSDCLQQILQDIEP